MQLFVVQLLSGLASAASLFLVASGLSLIFGVTRIVNFAHGAFFMLGAYLAFTLTDRFSGPFGFWGGMALAATLVGLMGALFEMLLLRRIYRASELFQLLATFGATLVVEDVVLLIWGPEDLLAPRAPGLAGAIEVVGKRVPSYDLFLIALGPLVLTLMWLTLHRTRWGVLVRAATQDRDMVAALGVNQKWLFTGVFALGTFLAGLGGALQAPREAVDHTMDLPVIVEIFVVVVIGGLGSIEGAFVAAILVSLLNAFGILILPKISLVLVFLLMALVLVVRPRGLFGRREAAPRASGSAVINVWKPLDRNGSIIASALVVVAALAPLALGPYGLAVATEIAIFVLFAASLHLLVSVSGLASFGHAAFLGLGAYGVAIATKALGLPMLAALVAGPLLAAIGAAVIGWFAVRLSGVYAAMLTLAFAQILWSIAFQWDSVTGGDNGMLGVWPSSWAAGPAAFYWLTLFLVVLTIGGLRIVIFSPFGYALRAARDSELRSEAIGINRRAVQWRAFVIAGASAGLAGALFAFLKGSVFPDTMGVSTSIDGLVMVLLGGVETVSGPIVGAVVYKLLSIWLVSHTDYSKLVLGLVIIGLVLIFPKGIVGSIRLPHWRPVAAPHEKASA
jgi:branched-chain amino acid transport system permease protein